MPANLGGAAGIRSMPGKQKDAESEAKRHLCRVRMRQRSVQVEGCAEAKPAGAMQLVSS